MNKIKIKKRPHLNQWLGVGVHACYPQLLQNSTNRKIVVHVGLGIKQDPDSKMINTKGLAM
jgi:hypothetical protein